MFFDRESTVVITKLYNLSDTVLTTYCQKFGKVLRCFIKTSTQIPKKEPYALIKFAEASSVASILSHRNHTINGTHVVMRSYHEDRTNSNSAHPLPSLMSLNQQTQNSPNNKPIPVPYDQLAQENIALKSDIATLQKSLAEAQTYSKTAYDTFQILREKFEAEQVLTNKLKSDIESYEERLRQIPSSSSSSSSSAVTSSVKIPKNDKVKDEPIDCDSHQTNLANHLLEIQTVKDCLEQAQIDLGKCQTENAILNAKLNSRDQQFDTRYKELNNQYLHMKRQYDHISLCVKDFYTKVYERKRFKTESKEVDTNADAMDDSNDDIVEIIMQVEPVLPET